MGTLLLLVLAASSAAPRPDLVRLAIPIQADAVRRSLAKAMERMEDARCQKVLIDFHDAAGRTLRENLDAMGETPSGLLGRLFFYDGDRLPACADEGSRTFALTSPGSRVIFVCGTRFHAAWQRNPPWGEVTLIHEALHSLGLGENPPSSEAISRHVAWTCPP